MSKMLCGFRRGWTLPFLAAVIGVAVAQEPDHLPKSEAIRITAHGSDRDNSASVCEGFSLSRKGVARFLSTAKIISSAELHHEYIQAPCYVKGTARIGGRKVTWEIRAAGTAWVEFPDGNRTLLGDVSQKEQQE